MKKRRKEKKIKNNVGEGLGKEKCKIRIYIRGDDDRIGDEKIKVNIEKKMEW